MTGNVKQDKLRKCISLALTGSRPSLDPFLLSKVIQNKFFASEM
jgi:hypothetical protein